MSALDGPQVAGLLHEIALNAATQRQTVCEAYAVTVARGQPAAWTAFQEAARPWDTLAPEARAVLGDPKVCTQ